jgi:hypothetical protein
LSKSLGVVAVGSVGDSRMNVEEVGFAFVAVVSMADRVEQYYIVVNESFYALPIQSAVAPSRNLV